MAPVYLDTITAIATPPGAGAIGIVRISGSNSLAILKKIFSTKKLFKPRFLYHGTIEDPDTKQAIDDVCCVYFQAPNSYTGEDAVEIHTHSNPQILKKVTAVIMALGARLAKEGEFTKRAFINGKVDLTEAESVIDLIEAKSTKAQSIALSHYKGSLFKYIGDIRKRLVELLENIEAYLNFPDDIKNIDYKKTSKLIDCLLKKTKIIINTQDFGQLATAGVKCVIVGRPNVGKSSLLNALVGKERSIVTAIPGTTRDFIDIEIQLGGLIFEFIDTAGFWDAKDAVEKLGIKKIATLLRSANLVLWVLDASQKITEEDLKIYEKIKNKKNVYILLNKSDKKPKLDTADLKIIKNLAQIKISAKKGSGLEALKAQLLEDYIKRYESIDLDLVCNSRQMSVLQSVYKILLKTRELTKANLGVDIIALELKEAIRKLGEITGQEITEEVLDGIFSRFCIGK
jgi:tRNA modification GTPase